MRLSLVDCRAKLSSASPGCCDAVSSKLQTRDQSECLRWDTVDSHITLSYITQLGLCSAWSMQIFSCMISTVVLTNNQPKAFKNSCFKCPTCWKCWTLKTENLDSDELWTYYDCSPVISASTTPILSYRPLWTFCLFIFAPGAIQYYTNGSCQDSQHRKELHY